MSIADRLYRVYQKVPYDIQFFYWLREHRKLKKIKNDFRHDTEYLIFKDNSILVRVGRNLFKRG